MPFSLYVPIAAILAIYARENGQGMFFDAQSDRLGDDEQPLLEDAAISSESPALHAVDTADTASEDPVDSGDEPPKPPSPGRPSLRIIK